MPLFGNVRSPYVSKYLRKYFLSLVCVKGRPIGQSKLTISSVIIRLRNILTKASN